MTGVTCETGALSAVARRELEDIYRRTDEKIARSAARCWLRGGCCDFEKADYRLYASSVEIAYARERHPAPFPPGSALCPFWRNGLCAERERRPLGCRTYFCDRSYSEEMRAIYEESHRMILELADRHGIPYRYEPFVDALRRCDSEEAASPSRR